MVCSALVLSTTLLAYGLLSSTAKHHTVGLWFAQL